MSAPTGAQKEIQILVSNKVSAKLFDEGASCRQSGKAPAIIDLALPNNSTPVPRLNVSRLVKGYNLVIQLDFQSVGSDSKLDDIGISAFVRQRITAIRLRHLVTR
jgi:hypothetical protein